MMVSSRSLAPPAAYSLPSIAPSAGPTRPPTPKRGPAEWFAEAHEVGLGVELELFAIRMACERSRLLPQDSFMAVNVSPVTALRPDLLELLDLFEELVRRHDVDDVVFAHATTPYIYCQCHGKEIAISLHSITPVSSHVQRSTGKPNSFIRFPPLPL